MVGWGEGTEDEMCLAFLGVTLDREKLTLFGPFTPAKIDTRQLPFAARSERASLSTMKLS